MMICPKCEGCIRNGEDVRVSVLAKFFREDVNGHRLEPFEEEFVEHVYCLEEPWEERLVKRIKRFFR